jgi:hypothetical protein
MVSEEELAQAERGEASPELRDKVCAEFRRLQGEVAQLRAAQQQPQARKPGGSAWGRVGFGKAVPPGSV